MKRIMSFSAGKQCNINCKQCSLVHVAKTVKQDVNLDTLNYSSGKDVFSSFKVDSVSFFSSTANYIWRVFFIFFFLIPETDTDVINMLLLLGFQLQTFSKGRKHFSHFPRHTIKHTHAHTHTGSRQRLCDAVYSGVSDTEWSPGGFELGSEVTL